jgi:hypothetical protein
MNAVFWGFCDMSGVAVRWTQNEHKYISGLKWFSSDRGLINVKIQIKAPGFSVFKG